MAIKGNGAVNTMEAVKVNTKQKEKTKFLRKNSTYSFIMIT